MTHVNIINRDFPSGFYNKNSSVIVDNFKILTQNI